MRSIRNHVKPFISIVAILAGIAVNPLRMKAQFVSCTSAPAGSACLPTGNVGIGTSSPTQLLTISNGVSLGNPVFGVETGTPVYVSYSSGSGTVQGMIIAGEETGANTLNGLNIGLDTSATNANNITTSLASGGGLRNRAVIYHSGTGTLTGASAYSVRVRNDYSGAGAITDGVGFNVETPAVGTGITNNSFSGLRIEPTLPLQGTLNNYYGVYIDQLKNTGVTNSWGIYQANGADNNYFAGYVGIGVHSPSYPLSVKGTIGAGEVVVTNTSGWSDYVFDRGYRLAPLSEVATFIEEHHHLPDIPSASEVDQKGVSLGELQSKLLAKIEELTLHMIQMEQKNVQLEQQSDELVREVQELKRATPK